MKNAANTPLNANSGTVPNMAETLSGWFQKIQIGKVIKTVVNFKVIETMELINFQGVWQPFGAEQLRMKPEGQRSWKWFMIHTHTDLKLKTDDIIVYLGDQYRVRDKGDYKEYGYYEYHVCKDYTGSGPTNANP